MPFCSRFRESHLSIRTLRSELMSASLQSLIDSGTKLYLDSVEPSEIDQNLKWGAVGATSNPAIISGIVAAGGFDERIDALLSEGLDDESIAWALTDELVSDAEKKFAAIHESTAGNAGWVSFELDPILEDPDQNLSPSDIAARYIELGKQWAAGHTNRMIKVPATEAGLLALEELAAAGITLNVTLMFTGDQYHAAREAVWKGAQRAAESGTRSLDQFKSVYSIFISRIDVYTQKELPNLSPEAQGQVGILNAKRIWKENQSFWADKNLKLEQELIFASTGTKSKDDPPWKYVAALAGSDIQTNPPSTNEAVDASGKLFTREVDDMPSQAVQDEIDAALDIKSMHKFLMDEGVDKFVKPQRELLAIIAAKREELTKQA
ncbi:MAG: transaldolase family protein [Rhodopirellula sp. JB055]|uniref:transaldolase family protein n=1 Tax=Rhodopirellula sp. JB055 TaxID=3342846 RepID=UPI00370B708A